MQSTTFELSRDLREHTVHVLCACQLRDGRIVTGGGSEIIIRDSDGQPLQQLIVPQLLACVTSLNNGGLFTGGGAATVWSSEGTELCSQYINTLSAVQLRDGRIVLGGDTMIVVNADLNVRQRLEFKGVRWIRQSIQLHDGTLAIAVDSHLKVLNIGTFSEEVVIRELTCLTGVAQHHNGTIISCSDTTSVWDANTGQLLQVNTGQRSYRAAVLRDGRVLLGFYTGAVVINTSTMLQLASFHAHTDFVCNILQLHDSRVLTSGRDTAVKMWRVDDYINTGESMSLVVYFSVAHLVEIGSVLAVLMRSMWLSAD